MCGILALLGCSDDSQAKRVRVLELSRRQLYPFNSTLPLSLWLFILSVHVSLICPILRCFFLGKHDRKIVGFFNFFGGSTNDKNFYARFCLPWRTSPFSFSQGS